jgi:hypothetical protein
MRDPIIKRYKVPMAVITLGDEDIMIKIIETGWEKIYSVIYEDAYQSQDCGHTFMTSEEIEEKYNIDVVGILTHKYPN